MHPADELDLLRAHLALHFGPQSRVHPHLPDTFPAPLPHLPELALIGSVEGGWGSASSVALYYRATLPEDDLQPLLIDAFTAQDWHDFQHHFPAFDGFLTHDAWPDRDRIERTGLHTLGHPPTRCILSLEMTAREQETLVVMVSPQQYGHDHELWTPDPTKFRTPMPALHVCEGMNVEVLDRHQRFKAHDTWGHAAAHVTGQGRTTALHEHFAQQLQSQGWRQGHTSLAEPLSSSAWQVVDAISEVHGTLVLRRLGEGHWLARFEAARLVETGAREYSIVAGG